MSKGNCCESRVLEEVAGWDGAWYAQTCPMGHLRRRRGEDFLAGQKQTQRRARDASGHPSGCAQSGLGRIPYGGRPRRAAAGARGPHSRRPVTG